MAGSYHERMSAARHALVLGLILVLAVMACSSRSPDQPPPRYAGVARAIAAGEAPKTTSVLVMRAGKIEHEAYFDGATAETLHDTRSVGKSVTALAVGLAIEKGLLRTDTRVFEELADLAPFANPGPLKEAITVEDLLTMSSALACDDNDANSPGNEENMYPLERWTRWAVDLPAAADYVRDASGRGPWHYCTAGTVLLGQTVQRVAKQPIDAFIAEHIFAPLGIERWELAKSPTGEIMTGGGLRLRTRDFAALAWMLRSRGKYGDQQVVPAAFIDAAFTRHRVAFPDAPQYYGYLFWSRTHRTPCGDVDAWFMSGNGGNVVAVFPTLDAIVVITRTHYNQGRAMHEQTRRLLDEHILPELCAGT